LNVFLEFLAAQTGVKYLNIFFLHIMDRHRAWRNLQSCFTQSASSCRPDHPMLSEPTILIPCHVNGNHWVALVRRILHGRIYFLYSDDMNHLPTEYKLKQLIETTASKEFYPTNAIWINCKSTTFRPHSNECGPRTLLALTVLGLHPAPDTLSLLPFMAGNLAQILQTWAASSILSGKIPIPDLVFPRYAYQAAGQSTPFSLISWDPSHHHLIGRHDTVLQLSAIQTGRIPQRKTD